MKIYNVLFESDYEGEDVQSEIASFKCKNDAVKCLEKALNDEIVDSCYTEEHAKKCVVRDDNDFFCLYYNSAKNRWKFRGTIYETELS